MDLLAPVAFFGLIIGTVLGIIIVIHFVKVARRLVKLIDTLQNQIEHKSGGIVFKE
jgi:hypothetical protein